VDLRATKTLELYDRRTTMDAPLDRWTISFWLKAMGDRSWRRLDPSLWEWELAYGPIIDRLKPDIIHANDFRMLGVGARAAMRARAKRTRHQAGLGRSRVPSRYQALEFTPPLAHRLGPEVGVRHEPPGASHGTECE
jgi:hypothetical protein